MMKLLFFLLLIVALIVNESMGQIVCIPFVCRYACRPGVKGRCQGRNCIC